MILVPWRFGLTSHEKSASYIHVRANAFISRAIFRTPVHVLAVGDPVVGYIEPTNGTSGSAQLVRWSPVDLEYWARASPVTFPTYFELRSDSIYPLPQLHGGNFEYLRVPHLNVGFFESPPPVRCAQRPFEPIGSFDESAGCPIYGARPAFRG